MQIYPIFENRTTELIILRFKTNKKKKLLKLNLLLF